MHRVFVYGTLKRGFENHALLKNARFIGPACTVESYRMSDGEFPVLRDGGGAGRRVSGELYEVDDETLSTLDELEEVESGMYERREADVIVCVQAAPSLKAFIYVGRADYWDYRAGEFYATVDARGHLDWRPRPKNRS